VSDVIESGRLHPVTAVRRAWVLISVIGWFVFDHRDIFAKVADKYGLWGP
jgi:hypothetical protein